MAFDAHIKLTHLLYLLPYLLTSGFGFGLALKMLTSNPTLVPASSASGVDSAA